MSRHQSIDNPRRWEKAISRARDKGTNRVEPRWTYREAGRSETFVTVANASREGEAYGVRIHTNGDDGAVTCNCECGMHGKYRCWHMAAVLLGHLHLREEVAVRTLQGRLVAARTDAIREVYSLTILSADERCRLRDRVQGRRGSGYPRKVLKSSYS